MKALDPLELGDYFYTAGDRPWNLFVSQALDTTTTFFFSKEQLISDAEDWARVYELIMTVRVCLVDFMFTSSYSNFRYV